MASSSVKSTYKSNDTEEWLDRVWTRPIGYLWAKLFERLDVHPNVVTVLSMIIGAASALFFFHGSYWYEGTSGLVFNIVGVLLLAWGNFYDSADGQLARMTGKKTRLGRILDGAASEVWFIPIYIALVLRFYFHHDREFSWVGLADTEQTTFVATLILFVLVLYSGFHCHSGQCGLADYYRQIHLFFLKGEAGSELDTSAQQQELYRTTPWHETDADGRKKSNVLWKLFLNTYVGYTRKQERQTPEFQHLMQSLRERYGDNEDEHAECGNTINGEHRGLAARIPQAFRDKFRAASLPLMKWTNILTFNTRAIALYTCCLLDLPWLYFVFEIVVMTLLCRYMRHEHEKFCRRLRHEL